MSDNTIRQNRQFIHNEVGPLNADPANPRFAFLFGKGVPTLSRVHGAAHRLARRPGGRHKKRLPDFLGAPLDDRGPAGIKLKAVPGV